MLLIALRTRSSTIQLAAFATAATIAICYLSAAYLTFARHNLSPFDLATGTLVARTRSAGTPES